MMKTLVILDRPVLNFFDLHNDLHHNEFSPAKLFSQINSFIEFAEVHCLPLQTQIKDKNSDAYVAKFLTKNFWFEILRHEEWSSEKKTIEECFIEIFEKKVLKEINDTHSIESVNEENFRKRAEAIETIKESYAKEIKDAQIIEKLKFISDNSKQSNSNVILMLAIAELAEIDSTKIDWSQWKILSNNVNAQNNEPQKFNCTDERIALTAGENIYKYYYYDDETLMKDSTIKTMKIEAKGSTNQFAEVKIELYSEKKQCCVQRMRLKPGEYIYCNVADGRIIKFLPNISINSEHILLRENYAESAITIFTKGDRARTVNDNNVKNASSFAVGVGNDGFILIQNGKINYSFYQPASDHFVSSNLDVIANVVEALLTQNGYKFLLSNGNVISSYEHSENNSVSLNSAGRYPLPEVTGLQYYKEAAISEGSAAIITGNKDKKFYVQFADETNGQLIVNGQKISLNQ